MSKKKLDKCHFCGKKKLILIFCHCGNKFCINHKCAENHNCTFDYKKAGQEKLFKDNPKIKFTKVLSI